MLLLGIWVYFSLTSTSIKISEPLPIGNSFDGNEQVPIKEFKEKYQSGVQILSHLKNNIHVYKVLSSFSEWITFLLTAIITIFIGIQGKIFQTTSGLDNAEKIITFDSEKYSKTNRRLMIVAALCSVLVAFNGICKSKLESSVKNATELNTALYKSRANWFNAKTPEEASSALKDLDEYLITNQ